MARPCSGTPWARVVILLHRQASNSILHPCPPLTLLTPWSLPDEKVQVAPCTVACTCCRLMSCSTPVSKLSTFYVTWYMGKSNNPGGGMFCPQNPKRPTRYTTTFFVVEDSRHDLSFTLEVESWYAPDYWTPKNFTELITSWIFTRFISYPLEHVVSYRSLLLILSNQYDGVSVMDMTDVLHDILTVLIFSDYIMTGGMRINKDLRKTIDKCSYSVYCF